MNVCMNVKQLKRILINEKMLDEKKKNDYSNDCS